MSHGFHLFWWLTKAQRLLFSLCWRVFVLIYFLIGVGALALLFLIEAQFFSQITRQLYVGYGIAAIFEVTKIGTNLMKQAIAIANRITRVKVSPLILAVSAVAQVVLIALTLTCSVVVVTSYLDGSVFYEGWSEDRPAKRETAEAQPVVQATLTTLQRGLRITIKPETFTSLFALLLSGIFQAAVYIIFGHLLATQAREIEYIFEAKMSRMDAKKNFMPT